MFALKEKTHPFDYDTDGSSEILDLELTKALPSEEASSSSLRTALRRLSPSTIAEDVALEGNVSAKGEIQLDGEVHGDVHCAALEIGPKGLVVGKVVAADVVIAGRVRGPVNGEHVTLRQTADVEGDIYSSSLAMEQGARFEGRAQRNRPPVEIQQDPPQQAASAPARAEYLPSPGRAVADEGAQDAPPPIAARVSEQTSESPSRNGLASPLETSQHTDAA